MLTTKRSNTLVILAIAIFFLALSFFSTSYSMGTSGLFGAVPARWEAGYPIGYLYWDVDKCAPHITDHLSVKQLIVTCNGKRTLDITSSSIGFAIDLLFWMFISSILFLWYSKLFRKSWYKYFIAGGIVVLATLILTTTHGNIVVTRGFPFEYIQRHYVGNHGEYTNYFFDPFYFAVDITIISFIISIPAAVKNKFKPL